MIARVVAWSGRHPRLVLAAALAAAIAGDRGRRSLARDAIPDLADPQILVLAEWIGSFGDRGRGRGHGAAHAARSTAFPARPPSAARRCRA